MARVGRLLAEDLAGRDRAQRRVQPLHRAHLDRRGVGAQHELRTGSCRGVPRTGRRARKLAIERVVRVARGVVGRDVQRLEVVVLELDLGAVEHREAHRSEQVLELARDLRQRMQRTALGAPAGQRRVEVAARSSRRERERVECCPRFVDQRLDRALQVVRGAAGGRPLLRGNARDLGQQAGDDAVLVQVAALHAPQLVGIGRLLDPGAGLIEQGLVSCFHAVDGLTRPAPGPGRAAEPLRAERPRERSPRERGAYRARELGVSRAPCWRPRPVGRTRPGRGSRARRAACGSG